MFWKIEHYHKFESILPAAWTCASKDRFVIIVPAKFHWSNTRSPNWMLFDMYIHADIRIVELLWIINFYIQIFKTKTAFSCIFINMDRRTESYNCKYSSTLSSFVKHIYIIQREYFHLSCNLYSGSNLPLIVVAKGRKPNRTGYTLAYPMIWKLKINQVVSVYEIIWSLFSKDQSTVWRSRHWSLNIRRWNRIANWLVGSRSEFRANFKLNSVVHSSNDRGNQSSFQTNTIDDKILIIIH